MSHFNTNDRVISGFDSQDPYGEILGVLQPWFNEEHDELYGTAAVMGRGVVMGCPIWGQDYLDRFFNICLPTLGSPGNIKALAGRCRLVLFIDGGDRPQVHRRTGWLRRAGIEVILRAIPPAAMAILPHGYYARFRLLGCVGNILTHMAGRWGMGLHMYQPDHLYAQDYFSNLLRLGALHDAIAQISMNASLTQELVDEIEPFRTPEGFIAIPDVDLGDIGFRHMHGQCQLHSMNDAAFPYKIPLSHRLWWQGKDAVHMYSAHENPAWLSPALCADAPVAFTSTLDTMLPELIPGEFYVPTREDGLTFIEVSDGDKPANRPYVSLDEFCGEFWRNGSFSREYVPYFSRPSLIPIKPKASYITDEVIKKQFDQILEGVMATEDSVALEWLRKKYSSRFAKAVELPELLR